MGNYIYYNHNPRGKEVGDCAIRAIGYATNETWEDTYRNMFEYSLVNYCAFNDRDFIKEYLEYTDKFIKYGKPSRKLNGRKKFYTVLEFSKLIAEKGKTYVVQVAHHLVCVKDKKIYDTWDCTYKVVYGYCELKD